jgi:hypothetical protein
MIKLNIYHHNSIKMKTTQVLIVSLFLLSILFSCEDEETTSKKPDFYKVDSSLNSMFFDEDSYWVYENSDKSKTDSVVIKDIIKDTLELGPSMPGQGITGYAEYYSVEYLSSQFGKYYEQLVGYIISQGCIYGGYLYLSSHHVGDSSWNAEITEIYDTLLVGENTFFDVVKMEILKDAYINSDINLYYVDSIGIVKKEIKEGNLIKDTWNLARYNVNLYPVN